MNKKLLVALSLIMGLSFSLFAGCDSTSSSSSVDSTSGATNSESASVESTCSHTYDNTCDSICNECGDERTPADHVYENACDVDCNECGAMRTPADHVYENACDVDCNECGATRTPTDHVYENACDVDCNECGATRTPADHVYENACDVACNECGAEREVEGHTYDSACDLDCNKCGTVREVEGHAYDNACDIDCNVCGETRAVGTHVYTDDSDEDCNECGVARVITTLETRQDIDLDLTWTDTLVVSNENATLDISTVADVVSVSSVAYNGVELVGVSYADGKVSVAKATFGTAFGEATVVVTAEKNDGTDVLINVPVVLITKAISNAAELDAMYVLADALDKNASGKSYAFISDGYFVLDQNIAYNKAYTSWPTWDAAGGKWRKADVHGFKGTIDGRGYTIDGMEISQNFNAFVTLLHTEGVIENIGFTNAKLTGIASSFVCCWGGGTMENIYVQYAAGVFGAGGGYNGTFFATDAARNIAPGNGLKIYDCFVDASKITAEGTTNKSCFIGYAWGKAENLDLTANYVTMHGAFAIGAEGVSNKYAIYTPDNEKDFYFPFADGDAMLAHSKTQRELATWNTTYWTITNGVPTWNIK